MVGYAAYGTNYIVSTNNKLQLQEIKLRSYSSELKELELKYDKVNTSLDAELHKNKQNDNKLKKIQAEKQHLEKQKKELEKKLQAKIKSRALAKAEAERAASVAISAMTASATASASSGASPEAWMEAAGIPKSDWVYVDCVIAGCQGVSAEGGWDGATRWNTAGSGAYGLCQALPGNKMSSAGGDWETNPVTQLRWCHEYAQAYGGWAAAWNFRKCTGNCYSARTGTTVYKDHTWW